MEAPALFNIAAERCCIALLRAWLSTERQTAQTAECVGHIQLLSGAVKGKTASSQKAALNLDSKKYFILVWIALGQRNDIIAWAYSLYINIQYVYIL